MAKHSDLDHSGLTGTPMGWAPVAFPFGYSHAVTFGNNFTIAANGGSLAIAIVLPARMALDGVRIRNSNTATARTWGWDLYRQATQTGSASENTLARVAACSANETFTPSAASNRDLTAGSAPVLLSPGVYWLVVQNRHASNSFDIASTAGISSTFFAKHMKMKTTTNPNGATLDFVAATWTRHDQLVAAGLRGRVFGESAPIAD